MKNNPIFEFDNEYIATMLGIAHINELKCISCLEIIISEH